MQKKQLTQPQAIDACHTFLLWMIPVLDTFPRNRRYTLGERLENLLLEILENLVEAAFSQHKIEPLTRVNRKLEICRHLWRLCYELKIISVKRYEFGSGQMLGLGSQVGGWLRVCKR